MVVGRRRAELGALSSLPRRWRPLLGAGAGAGWDGVGAAQIGMHQNLIAITSALLKKLCANFRALEGIPAASASSAAKRRLLAK